MLSIISWALPFLAQATVGGENKVTSLFRLGTPDVLMDGLEAPKNYINPVHVRDVITGIAHLLEGSSTGIGEYLNNKWEMEAEYRHEMGAEMRAEFESDYRAYGNYH